MYRKFWITLVLFLGSSNAIFAIDNGVYHISNLFDGSLLESRFDWNDYNYGKNYVFTDDLKCGAKEQLWKVRNIECTITDCKSEKSHGYVLLNEKTSNNEVTDSRPENSTFSTFHFYELLPVFTNGKNVFNIRSKEHNKCLVNFGDNGFHGPDRRIGWWPKCESFSTNQLWKFHPVV